MFTFLVSSSSATASISMVDFYQDIFSDSFHGFMAQELNESSENEGDSEEENGEETDNEAKVLQAGGNVQRLPDLEFGLPKKPTDMVIKFEPQKAWMPIGTLQQLKISIYLLALEFLCLLWIYQV